MASENHGKQVSIGVAADLSTKQFCFVKVTADRTINVCAEGEAAVGVLQDKPNVAGHPGCVMLDGVSKVTVGVNAITAGQNVKADALGKGDVAASGDVINGVALTGGAAGTTIEVILVSKHLNV